PVDIAGGVTARGAAGTGGVGVRVAPEIGGGEIGGGAGCPEPGIGVGRSGRELSGVGRGARDGSGDAGLVSVRGIGCVPARCWPLIGGCVSRGSGCVDSLAGAAGWGAAISHALYDASAYTTA